MKITQELLRRDFTYNLDTGEFFRTVIRDRWGNETPVLRKVGTLRVDGYLDVNIGGDTYKCHRLAFLYVAGFWSVSVDHINGTRTDNRWVNLREVDKITNMRNRGINRNNTSGATGVNWFPDTSQWRARINLNGQRLSLGLFDTIEEAVEARRVAEAQIGYYPNHGRRQAWVK